MQDEKQIVSDLAAKTLVLQEAINDKINVGIIKRYQQAKSNEWVVPYISFVN